MGSLVNKYSAEKLGRTTLWGSKIEKKLLISTSLSRFFSTPRCRRVKMFIEHGFWHFWEARVLENWEVCVLKTEIKTLHFPGLGMYLLNWWLRYALILQSQKNWRLNHEVKHGHSATLVNPIRRSKTGFGKRSICTFRHNNRLFHRPIFYRWPTPSPPPPPLIHSHNKQKDELQTQLGKEELTRFRKSVWKLCQTRPASPPPLTPPPPEHTHQNRKIVLKPN